MLLYRVLDAIPCLAPRKRFRLDDHTSQLDLDEGLECEESLEFGAPACIFKIHIMKTKGFPSD